MSNPSKQAYTQALLQRIAQHDDKEAFARFFDLYYAKLLQFALLFVPYRQQAEDIVSEVMIQLLKKRKQLVKIEKFEGYLFLAVKNQALNSLKRSATRLSYHSIALDAALPVAEAVNPERKMLDDELRELIYATVEKLPPRRRMIYKLIKDDGLRNKEVAHLLEITPKTVENHLELAIREVRQAVSRYLAGKQIKPLLDKIIQSTAVLCLLVS